MSGKSDANARTLTLAATASATLGRLVAGLGKDDRIARADLPPDVVAALDAAARAVSGRQDCDVEYVYGCNSCCADNISGSLIVTTCGQYCSKVCGNTACY
jgi:hypothetical protein